MWIKSKFGALVNLEHVRSIVIVEVIPGSFFLKCWYDSTNQSSLMSGTKEECEKVRSILMNELRDRGKTVFQITENHMIMELP